MLDKELDDLEENFEDVRDADDDEVGALAFDEEPVVVEQAEVLEFACSFSIFSFSRSLSRSMIRFPTLMVS